MPTQLLRTQVTHTPLVMRALETARETWSDETDGKLLLHLIEAGEQHLREQHRQEPEGLLPSPGAQSPRLRAFPV